MPGKKTLPFAFLTSHNLRREGDTGDSHVGSRVAAVQSAPRVGGRNPGSPGRWSEPGGSHSLQRRVPGDHGILPRPLPQKREKHSIPRVHRRSHRDEPGQLHSKSFHFLIFLMFLCFSSLHDSSLVFRAT